LLFAFGHAGPSTWNTLLNNLKCNSHTYFQTSSKHFYVRFTSTFSMFEVVTVNALYKLLICCFTNINGFCEVSVRKNEY